MTGRATGVAAALAAALLVVAAAVSLPAVEAGVGAGVEAGVGAGVEADLQVRLGDTVPPRLLSETGLYRSGGRGQGEGGIVDPRNRPFSPQYPLWSDGARKSRWVRLPPGARIDARNVDRWDFPAGTRFWKEFAFGGRKVETRFLRKDGEGRWTFASYVWNDEQTDAVRAPEEGVPDVTEIAPGRRHSIPAVTDCRACHDPALPVASGFSRTGNAAGVARTDILGFTALQLSTDRDPGAPHAEPLAPGMITLRTLVEERLLESARPDVVAALVTAPPRIAAPDARTRSVLGYLSTNCGSCHNEDSSIASLGLLLKATAASAASPVAAALVGAGFSRPVGALLRPTSKWQIPHAAPGASRFITPGAPDLSALLVRMRSRRPSSQMPPLGSVLQDREAIDLVTKWIEDLPRQ